MIPTSANAAEVKAICDALSATPIGEICSYETLDAALGSSIRARRYLVPKAMQQLNKENGAIFGAVIGIGYKRLSPDEAHTLGAARRESIRRGARRTSATIARAVNAANDVAPDAKRKAGAEVAVLNMVAHVAGDRVVKDTEAAPKPPTLAETISGVLRHLGAPAA